MLSPVIVDTIVVVAGLLTSLADSPVVRVLDGMLVPDPGDQHLWELLVARKDLLLVTGEKKLQRDRAMGPRILTPAVFVDRLQPT